MPVWCSGIRKVGAMRVDFAADQGDCRFDLPPHFAILERRMSGLALDAWAAGGRALVPGFDANSLVIVDPGGRTVIESAGDAIAATFGLAPGQALERRGGLSAELCAACDLIALRPLPVPFEASLMGPRSACILVRGVALPIIDGARAVERVQVVVSWREVLGRAATVRLQRELGAALRQSRAFSANSDPFSTENTC